MKTFKITETKFKELDDESIGLCLYCGEENNGCEPDARNYHCESCDRDQVFGAAEVLMMGFITIVGE